MRLTGKIVLLAGGEAEIAQAITTCFTAEGAEVFTDLDAAARRTGALDILVNLPAPCSGDFAELVASNLAGLFARIQAVLPALRRADGGGTIVNIAPCMGDEAMIGMAAFATITQGMRGLTKAAAVELGEDGIRVNMLQPGYIRRTTGPAWQEFTGMIPLHPAGSQDRAGLPEDIAQAACFLASDDAGYMTGTEFVVDGGLTQCRNSVMGRAYDGGTQAWPSG
jgi:3alpha(or 20beta)-hydroxysteroid dehydrogenase